MSVLYKIIIANTQVGNENSVNGLTIPRGFIDPYKIADYGLNANGKTNTPFASSVPTTLEQSISKSVANIRWEKLIENISENTVADIRRVVVTGGSAIVAPTSLEITVEIKTTDTVYTRDETNNNVLIYGIAAVKRQIARVLSNDHIVNTDRTIYNPASVENRISMIAPTAVKIKATVLLAEADVTVTEELVPNF